MWGLSWLSVGEGTRVNRDGTGAVPDNDDDVRTTPCGCPLAMAHCAIGTARGPSPTMTMM